jgi:hypothetical protein
MSRLAILLAVGGLAALGFVAVSQLHAQAPAAPAGSGTGAEASAPPRGIVAVILASAPGEAIRVRDVTTRTFGGRAFLVGVPAEGRQLAATPPQVWIPVDSIVQMTESGPAS